MKQITSTHNETFKHLKQLASNAKYRKKTNQTLLEGVHLCQGYLEQAGQPVLYVYTDKAIQDPEVKKILQVCDNQSVPGVLLGEANFRAISSLENSTGLLFIVNITTQDIPETFNGDTLLLENIQDPGNMGTILRVAAAASVVSVYISPGSASIWSPKVLRAGMGAHFAINIYENCDLSRLIQSSNLPVLATSLDATKTIYQQDLSGPVAWLFGNEGSGVSKELLALEVQKVIIPQNPQVESLNVAAATAVCLFEQVRQQSTN